MSRSFKTRALVISSSPRGEKDKLVDLFSEEEGRMAVLAYGARKPGSRFGSLLEPGMLLSVVLRQGRVGFPVLSECSPEKSFSADLQGLEEMTCLQELLDLIRSGLRDQVPDPDFFRSSVHLLELLTGHGLSPRVLHLLARIHLLRHAGILPDWSGCAGCGRVQPAMRVGRHGLFCEACGKEESPLARLAAGDVRILSLLSGGEYGGIAALRLQDQQAIRLHQALDSLLRYSRHGT